jgi:signal transduction histidine kinase/Tfp pilus assembly protein PilF
MVFFGCCFIVEGQGVQLIQESNNEDTGYVFTLLRQADDMRVSNPVLALQLSNEALGISRKMRSNLGVARSLNNVGISLLDASKYPQSKSAFYEAIYYAKQCTDQDGIILPKGLNNLGNVFSAEGNLDSAARYYYQALKAIKLSSRKDSVMMMIVYSNIGGTFARQQQGRRAFYYLNNSIMLALLNKDSQTLAHSYINLGLVYENFRQGDSAIYYYTQSKELNKKQHQKSILQSIYYRMGMTYGREGKLKLAKKYFDSAALSDPSAASTNVALQTGYGNVYAMQGSSKTAIDYYLRAINISIQKGNVMDNLIIYNNIADCYHNVGNNEMAYEYQKDYSNLKDSQMNLNQIKAINQLEIQYRIAAQEKDIVAKQLLITIQQKKILQKNIWLGGLLIGALLLVLCSLMLYRNYSHKQKSQSAEMANLELQQQTNRMQALMQGEQNERIRIARELHDGIGSIMAAARMHLDIFKGSEPLPPYAATYKNGIKLLDEAYHGLRNTAHNLLPPEEILEGGLIVAIALYCSKISKPGTFIVQFQHYGPRPEISPEIAISFYRIIQELIHNAAKHAEATEVIVEIGVEIPLLSINVEDNGKGWKIEDNIEKGMGIKNLKQRVAVLGGSLEIDSRLNIGTTIYVTCPIDKNDFNT